MNSLSQPFRWVSLLCVGLLALVPTRVIAAAPSWVISAASKVTAGKTGLIATVLPSQTGCTYS